jgi:hypothetical protein
MKVGDIILIDGQEWTIWFIKDNIYHIKDNNGNGICGDLSCLNSLINL